MEEPTGARPSVVIVGAGFAGLRLARGLSRAPVGVTILDRHNYHTFVPLLYQVATAGLEPEEIAQPIRHILRGVPNARFRLNTVIGVDLGRRAVITDAGEVRYDYLVLAAGSTTNYFGQDLAQVTSALRDLDDAERLRDQVLGTFEAASAEEDAARCRQLMTLIVVGGGPTGVELAGALAELQRRVLPHDYPDLDLSSARILLLEATDRILPGMPKALQGKAQAKLSELGVEIRFGAPVADADADGVTLRGIHYDDASSSERAMAAAEKLIQVDRVHVLIGPYGSDLTRAVVGVAREHGRLLWNHGGAVDDIHRPGHSVVSILTPVSRYFGGFFELVRSLDVHARKAVVLHRRSSRFGGLAARGAQAAGRRAGFVVDALTYSRLPEDLLQLLAKLRRQQPDLILSAGSFEDDCAVAQEIIATGMRTRPFALTAAAIREFGETLGADAEGIFAPSQWEPEARYMVDFGPSASQVARRIRSMGAIADYPAAQGYAACLIAEHCLKEAGRADDEALWRAACSLDCTTFFGRFRINPRTGIQEGHEMVWIQWQGGRKVVVWPPSVA